VLETKNSSTKYIKRTHCIN